VAGGAGFLGSNLCKRLVLDDENLVISLDNLYTGKLSNLKDLIKFKNFKFIQHDIINPIDLQVDEIYNAACPASPPAYQRSPTTTTKTCIWGITNLLELSLKCNAKLLQFSTVRYMGIH
jgi:UDP-glucuronate decarboxylase